MTAQSSVRSLIIAIAAFCVQSMMAATITLSWTAPTTDPGGYKLYTASQTDPTKPFDITAGKDLGKVTTTTVTIAEGTNYRFYVTDYLESQESGPSNTVSWPALTPSPSPTPTATPTATSATPTATPTATPATPTPTTTPTPAPTRTPTPTSTPIPSPSPSPSPTSSPPTVTPTPTPPIFNQRPKVNAGADQSILIGSGATLTGTATDDGLPAGGKLTYKWTQTAGPILTTIYAPGALSTKVSFKGIRGTYTFELDVTDGVLAEHDSITVVAK